MVSGRTKIFQGGVIKVARGGGAVALSVVIACKGTALLIEQHREQTAVQLIPDKLPQIHTGRISFDLFGHFAVFFQEVLAHQVVLHTPAQVDGHMVISIDGVNRQFLLLNALDMIGSIVHLTVKIIIGKGATGDCILAGGVHHKADPRHLVQQSVYIMFQFIVQLVLIKRNDLIEVDLLAARQSADLAAILRTLGTDQGSSTQFGVVCKWFPVFHGMTMPQPAVTVDGQTSQNFSRRMGQYHFSSFMDS